MGANRTCQECKKAFVWVRGETGYKYCSPACNVAGVVKNKVAATYKAAAKRTTERPKTPKHCRRCGAFYIFIYGSDHPGGSKYCSEACKWGTATRRVSCSFGCGRRILESEGPGCVTCTQLGRRTTQARRPPRTGQATVARMRARWQHQRRCCYWCGGPFEEVDHVIPRSRGGSDTEGNLVPCCRRCNLSRGSMLVIEVRRQARQVWGRTTVGGNVR